MGKAYYITTAEAWQRHTAKFANSHWVGLGVSNAILLLVDGDEGAHLALEDDAAFEALPHPMSPKLTLHPALAALSHLGGAEVSLGATTFDVAEAASRIHPLLRHRVF